MTYRQITRTGIAVLGLLLLAGSGCGQQQQDKSAEKFYRMEAERYRAQGQCLNAQLSCYKSAPNDVEHKKCDAMTCNMN